MVGMLEARGAQVSMVVRGRRRAAEDIGPDGCRWEEERG